MTILVTNRHNGTHKNIEIGKNIVLSDPSDVHINVPLEDIISTVRNGDNLIVSLSDGTVITIENYYSSGVEMLASRLLVPGEHGDVIINDDDVIINDDVIIINDSGLLYAGLGGLMAAGLVLQTNGSVDATAPGVPVIEIASGTEVSGTGAEVGATIHVDTNGDGNADFTTTVADDGTWSVTASPELSHGTAISVTATDADGNESTAAIDTIDATAPGVPVIEIASGTEVSGTGAEVGATIHVDTNGDGNADFTTTVADDGTWSVTASPELSHGTAISVTATDADGNESTAAIDTIDVVIDLGEGHGQLIDPIVMTIDGKERTFYHWDKNKSGIADNGDLLPHNYLDFKFNSYDDTTDVEGMRSATLNGVDVRLATLGNSEAVYTGLENGTVVDSPDGNQTTYDGMLAIWDAFNGDGTGTGYSGVPDGWASDAYWSATSPDMGWHASMDLTSGELFTEGDATYHYVALEVV